MGRTARRFRPSLMTLEARAVPAGPDGADPPPPPPPDPPAATYDPTQDPDAIEAQQDIDQGQLDAMQTAGISLQPMTAADKQTLIDAINLARDRFNLELDKKVLAIQADID